MNPSPASRARRTPSVVQAIGSAAENGCSAWGSEPVGKKTPPSRADALLISITSTSPRLKYMTKPPP